MKKVWFITGSQHLYGPETLKEVASHVTEMVDFLNTKEEIICEIANKGTLTTPDEITEMLSNAQNDKDCIGVIAWMHTFSPSKMWINGLNVFSKPFLHFHTQYNKEIPWNEIDMDFMNLNQAAHGDREHGFIHTRMGRSRKVIAGYYKEDRTVKRIENWMRVAVGIDVSKNLKVCRFGDNMRQVAVTEGNKVAAQMQFGWQVNTWAVGDLVKYVNAVTEADIDTQMAEYKERYDLNTDNLESVRYQAKLNVAMKKFLDKVGAKAFTDTFEDLHGLDQLAGLATQNLMYDGYGFGGEGDWKTSAMTHIIKEMTKGRKGGTSFMEDYTYHMVNDGCVLGSHMLEVCPTIANGKSRIEVHHLGIGGKNAPARVLFDGKEGIAFQISVIELNNRYRMVVNKVEAFPSLEKMPKLPVGNVMWKPLPNLEVATEAWIYSGAAHHTVMTYDLDVETLRDFAEYFDMEFVLIDENTKLCELKDKLRLYDLTSKLR
jgi:L-arabinose isomerase